MSALATFPPDNDRGQGDIYSHDSSAAVVPFPSTGQTRYATQVVRAGGGTDSRQAIDSASPIDTWHAGSDFPDDQFRCDSHSRTVVGDQTAARQEVAGAHDPGAGGSDSPTGQVDDGTHALVAGGDTLPAGTANDAATTNVASRSLLDPLLTLASITLDDLEKLRIAQENRYRSLTTHGTSEGGVEWGFGLDDNDPQVAQAGAMVDAIKALEHQGELNLNRLMRKHPLGPWVKAQRGIGEKQAARLLGIIGDPYINAATGQPRTVSQLWAYCGLHTLPARHGSTVNHPPHAGGEYNVAARRRKGEKANWSDDAKKRAWLIAVSCMKAGGPYRDVYDTRKAATEGRLHAAECVRCGPAGKPAQIGSPWSDGHRHADALRITSKAILRDLWRESRRLHLEGADQ